MGFVIMYRLKTYSVRSAFKAIQSTPSLTAALVFPHGIELLSVQPETETQEQQLRLLLQDFKAHLVGVYSGSVQFSDFAADVTAVKMELLLRDDLNETIDENRDLSYPSSSR